MSRRVRVPAPFARLQPSVIRQFGPRLVLIAGSFAALVFVIGGGSYVLSHVGTKTPARVPATSSTALPVNTPPDAQTLGAIATPTTTPNSTPTTTPDAATPSPTPFIRNAVSSSAAPQHATPSVPAPVSQTTIPVQAAVQTLLAPLQQILQLP